MVYGTEKSITKRTRVVIVAVLWVIVGIPVFVGLWFWASWWSLLLLSLAAWATWDYVKTGDMYTQIDHGMSHHVRTGEEGKGRFGQN